MREIMLCRYTYDALDRLVGTLPLSHTESQRFYCKNRLVTEIQGALTHSIFQHDDVPLGQQQSSDGIQVATLLATDQQRTILHSLGPHIFRPIAYTPYGHRSNGLLSLLGFNGEREDPVTGHYLLGNGYRAFNPVLMRFNSPDNWSPFGNGGLNPYAYCLGNPISRTDRTGHSAELVRLLEQYRPANKIPRPSILVSNTAKTAKAVPSDEYYLAGFHGTSSKNIDSLQKGLNSSYAGTANGQTEGVGFYATPDYAYAQHFAREAILLENPMIPSEVIFPYMNYTRDAIVKSTTHSPTQNTPVVMGVYVRNYQTKIAGKNFQFVKGDEQPIRSSEIIFPISMYEDIQVRPLPSKGNLPTPWINPLNIRQP